jgi:RNA polymerase sigma-70 factor, ECF subfamily
MAGPGCRPPSVASPNGIGAGVDNPPTRSVVCFFGWIELFRSWASLLGCMGSAGSASLSLIDDWVGACPTMSAATNDGRPDSADTALARAVVAGEPWAQRELWEQYAPMVHGVLRRALGSDHDFDDLLQDVFLRVFDRVGGLRDLTALRSFIYSVTIRVVRWEIRRAQSRRRRQAAALLHRDGPEAVAADPETRELLARAMIILDGMPKKERAVFVLRHVEGQGLADIAQGMDISLSTAKRWLKRGVRRIEKGIDRDAQLSSLLKERPAS